MYISAWCDLTIKGEITKSHAMCPNSKCNCQKQIAFTRKQFQLERCSIKSKPEKVFEGTEKSWNKFLKPAVNVVAPFMGLAVAKKFKNPTVGRATKKISKSIGKGKVLSLTETL